MNVGHKKILLLGYGEMGHAMEYLLSPSHAISIWDPFFEGELTEINLESVCSESDFIIFCTPTTAVFELSQRVSLHIPDRCICLSMAKSLDKVGRTAPQAFEQGLRGKAEYALLYGPMISEEIIVGRPGFATLTGTSTTCLKKVRALYQGTGLKLKIYDDIIGAAWCVVLKNVYALLFGMADELRLGDNMRGFLVVETLAEMANIVNGKNGLPLTPYTLAGLGDLITTVTSEDSHHHELGRRLARKERDDISGEGINTLNTINRLELLDTKGLPLFQLIERVVQQSENPEKLLATYIDAFTRRLSENRNRSEGNPF